MYAKSGHLLFLRGSTLMVSSFDSESLERTSEPVPAVDGIGSGRYGAPAVAITDRGTLYYRAGEGQQDVFPPQTIYQHKLEGDAEPQVHSQQIGAFRRLAVSPDGRFFALVVVDNDEGPRKVWLLDVKRNNLSLLTREEGHQDYPVFSPDGTWVYYNSSDQDGLWQGIYRRKRNRSGEAELVYQGPRDCHVRSISPDGQDLFVMEYPSESFPRDGY